MWHKGIGMDCKLFCFLFSLFVVVILTYVPLDISFLKEIKKLLSIC